MNTTKYIPRPDATYPEILKTLKHTATYFNELVAAMGHKIKFLVADGEIVVSADGIYEVCRIAFSRVEQKSFVKNTTTPKWEVYALKTLRSTHWDEPDDVDAVELGETNNFWELLPLVVGIFYKIQTEQWLENKAEQESDKDL